MEQSLLDLLIGGLAARLNFRKLPLTDAVQAVVHQAARAGLGRSGSTVIGVARVYIEEASKRAELVSAYLRDARMSWSPRQLIDSESAFRTAVVLFFQENLSETARLVDRVGGVAQMRHGDMAWQNAVLVFDRDTDEASKNALTIVSTTIGEIMQSARTELSARTRDEHPLYVISNTFQGPVGAVAQGSAAMGPVTQVNTGAVELVELARQLSAAIGEFDQSDRKAAEAVLAAVTAEAEAEAPNRDYLRVVIGRISGFAEKVGGGVASGALLGYLKAHGWVP